MLSFGRQLKIEIMTSLLTHTITDLRVDFDVTMTDKPEPNTANLTIHNLSKMSRDVIINDYKGISVSAGYGTAQKFFTGNIVQIKEQRNPTGYTLELSALDGHDDLKKARFDKTFAAGTPVQSIFASIAATVGLPFELGFVPRGEVLLVGTTFEGNVTKVLNKLCKRFNLRWKVLNGVLEISDADLPVFSALAQIVILTPDTGLIGSPQISMEESPEKGEPVGYINAVSLLNTKLLPDRPVQILPANPMTFAGIKLVKEKKAGAFNVNATGIYRIDTARFTGSNKSGSFNTEISCPIMG